MRWTAYITILFAIATASASATVPSAAPTGQPAPVRSPAEPGSDGVATARTPAVKVPPGSSKAYANGYRKGYAAGRAAARKQARALCAAPGNLPRRTAEPAADQPDAVQQPLANGRRSASTLSPDPSLKTGPMPLPLRGSYSSLERQNVRLEKEGLERIEDQKDLDARIANHLLVPLPASDELAINPKLPANRRYCRSWTAHFLSDLADAHDAAFHEALEVNSAVRTVAYQKRLLRANSNAAPAKGNVVSPHLTGAAVDIAKEKLTQQELAWMRRYLLRLQKAGKIDVEEEFQQACFHVTVYKNYDPVKPRSKPSAPPCNLAERTAVHNAPAAARPAREHVPPSSHPAKKSPPAAAPTEVIVSGQ